MMNRTLGLLSLKNDLQKLCWTVSRQRALCSFSSHPMVVSTRWILFPRKKCHVPSSMWKNNRAMAATGRFLHASVLLRSDKDDVDDDDSADGGKLGNEKALRGGRRGRRLAQQPKPHQASSNESPSPTAFFDEDFGGNTKHSMDPEVARRYEHLSRDQMISYFELAQQVRQTQKEERDVKEKEREEQQESKLKKRQLQTEKEEDNVFLQASKEWEDAVDSLDKVLGHLSPGQLSSLTTEDLILLDDKFQSSVPHVLREALSDTLDEITMSSSPTMITSTCDDGGDSSDGGGGDTQDDDGGDGDGTMSLVKMRAMDHNMEDKAIRKKIKAERKRQGQVRKEEEQRKQQRDGTGDRDGTEEWENSDTKQSMLDMEATHSQVPEFIRMQNFSHGDGGVGAIEDDEPPKGVKSGLTDVLTVSEKEFSLGQSSYHQLSKKQKWDASRRHKRVGNEILQRIQSYVYHHHADPYLVDAAFTVVDVDVRKSFRIANVFWTAAPQADVDRINSILDVHKKRMRKMLATSTRFRFVPKLFFKKIDLDDGFFLPQE
eukprot:m.54555 g.54555  ORF g.54555 m.54555 type:complete len:545 (-) comp7720_c0_seq11:1347-2981(-)